jgi:hypothetical protein
MPRSEIGLRRLLLFIGISQLALGAWQAISPGTFFDAVADFGQRDDHLLRDISTLYLALGVALIISAGRPSWRVPVLAFATLQYAFHSINHLIDIGDADPGWIGPFDFITLAATAALLAGVWRETGTRER